MLKNYLVAETAKQWIKGLEVHGDGRRDMMALGEDYSGEGNASRRIATAERMFNIYKEEQEEFSENAKIRELFKRVQHPQLQDTVKALTVRFDMEGLTYTQTANHLTAAVSELPEFHSTRRVTAARICGGSADTGTHNKYNNSAGKGAPKPGIRTADGKIFTAFYNHWRTLTDDEKQHVIEERKRKATKRARVAPRTTNGLWKNLVQSRSNSMK